MIGRKLLSLLVLCLAAMGSRARASTITAGVYALSGATAAGYSVTGNVTLNASGYVTTANLTFNDPQVGTPSFTNVGSTGFTGSGPFVDFAYISGSSGQIMLDYLQTPDASGALSLCVYGVRCSSSQASYLQIYTPSNFNGSGMAYLSGGTLQLANQSSAPVTAVTPEPSSLLLLGTGVLVVAGVIQSRSRSVTSPHVE